MNRREIGYMCTQAIAGASLFSAATTSGFATPLSATTNTHRALGPEQALRILLDGNRRFAGSMQKKSPSFHAMAISHSG
jgi:hypothetical protein